MNSIPYYRTGLILVPRVHRSGFSHFTWKLL